MELYLVHVTWDYYYTSIIVLDVTGICTLQLFRTLNIADLLLLLFEKQTKTQNLNTDQFNHEKVVKVR